MYVPKPKAHFTTVLPDVSGLSEMPIGNLTHFYYSFSFAFRFLILRFYIGDRVFELDN
jgi:hypothetical protein